MLPRQLSSPTANQQQLLSTITSRQEPDHQDGASTLQTWSSSFTASAKSPHGLTSATLAYFTAFLGRRDGDNTPVSASQPLYASGLTETHRAFKQPSTALSDEVLAACFALVTFEILECPESGPKAYYWHMKGCLKLIEMRGPRAHQHGLAHDLFLELRLHGALEAYKSQAPNFICSPAWMTLPFRFRPRYVGGVFEHFQ